LSALGIVTILAFAAADEAASYVTIWSPYYKVYYDPLDGRITTNNIGHQQMTRVGETGSAYMLPHLLNRDAGNAPFAQTMIIGAGSGNDVAAALAGKAEHIDAVEIEPVLNAIGRDHHPLRPYADPRVAIHLDDGRSFVRKAGNQYDLIEYALVDSLVLHSGYGSLRLESFLFTEQAFSRRQGEAQARRRVRDVQLLPSGLDRRPPREDGRKRVRDQAHRRLAPLHRRHRTRRIAARRIHVRDRRPGGLQAARGDTGCVRKGGKLLAQSAAARERANQRLQCRNGPRFPGVSRIAGSESHWPASTRPESTCCRPTTGRSFTCARRRFPA
jgi:hypothetical protein